MANLSTGLWGFSLALLLLGCTADNPRYRPGPMATDGAALDEDLRTMPPDEEDLRPIDPSLCPAGSRRCRPANGDVFVSQYCREGRFVDDRRCPVNAGCGEGYCTPPPPMGDFEGKPCQRENDCFGPMQPVTNVSCQPFVNPGTGTIESYCAVQISRAGTGFPGTPCRPPDGNGCRSGFCDEITHNSGTADFNYCFRVCETDKDCPNIARNCSEALVIVEQVTHKTQKSCVP